MRNIHIIPRQHNQRQRMIPSKPAQQPIHHRRHHTPHAHRRPEPAQQPHVAVLVAALVGLLVAARGPEQLDAEQPVLDRRQVGVRLHNHDVLHVEAVAGFRPVPEHDGAVDDGGDREGQVVVLEPFRAEGEEQGSRDGGDEDAEGDG